MKIPIKYRQLFLFVALLCASHLIQAMEDIEGSRDPNVLSRYPHSTISHFSELSTDDYTLYISSLKKVNGVWRADKQRSLAGELLRVTYLIPGGHSLGLVSEFYQKQFDALKGEQIFSCEKRGCGSSNQWANMVFQIKQLYGSDRNQFYRVDKFKQGAQEYYLVFYLVERGNGRIYAHIDLLTSRQENSDSVLVKLLKGNKVVVTEFDDESRVSLLKHLVSYLESGAARKLYIVGHSYGVESVSVLKSHSENVSRTLADQLAKKVDITDRVEVYGLGPLAPENSIANGRDRIELLPF